MAKINKTAVHDFVTGEYVLEQQLDQNFEVLRAAQNDTDARVDTLTDDTINADANLQLQIDANKTGITGLGTTKADKSYVDTQDLALQEQIDTNKTDIATNKGDISSLSTTKANKSYVDDQDAALQTQITSLGTNKADKTYVDQEITDLRTEVDQQMAGVEGAFAQRVSNIESDVTFLSGNKADITYVNEQVAAVQAGQIVPGAITTDMLADGTVTAAKVDGTTVYTAAQVDQKLGTIDVTPEGIGAAPADHTHTAADVGAVAKTGDEMSGNLSFNNGLGVQGKTTSGSSLNLVKVDESDSVVFGSTGLPARILSAGDPVLQKETADYTFWHTGNFNPASKLDTTAQAADSAKLGGQAPSAFVRTNVVNTFTSRQKLFAGIEDGDSNTDISIIKSLQLPMDTRSEVVTAWDTNFPEKANVVQIKNGSTVVATVTVDTRNTDGNPTKIVVTQSTNTITYTITWTPGKEWPDSITKV